MQVCPTETFAYLLSQLLGTYNAILNSHAGEVQTDSTVGVQETI
jgi:hypothetical protein